MAQDAVCTLLVVRIADRLFGFPLPDVREMVTMPAVTHLPTVPSYMRGLINLRGRVLPVVDLRIRLGLTSLSEEVESLVTLLVQREEDHKRWLSELEASVHERRPFSLTTDPNQCAFGRWYDNYTSQNSQVMFLLQKFRSPHNRIHEMGGDVVRMAARDAWTDAARLVETTGRNVLSGLQRLFEEVRQTLREANDEVAVVVEAGGRSFAVAVDAVEGVETMARTEPLATADGTLRAEVANVGISARDNRFVMILLTSRLLHGATHEGELTA